jgi:hypothetical protein
VALGLGTGLLGGLAGALGLRFGLGTAQLGAQAAQVLQSVSLHRMSSSGKALAYNSRRTRRLQGLIPLRAARAPRS